jgi:hypothetical protein
MDLGNLRLPELLQYLQGMNFPANKEEVASNAESNDTLRDVVGRIRSAATERFDYPEEVLQAVKAAGRSTERFFHPSGVLEGTSSLLRLDGRVIPSASGGYATNTQGRRRR